MSFTRRNLLQNPQATYLEYADVDWNRALIALRDELAMLYPTIEDASRVARQVGLSPARIRFGASPIDTWHAILREAQLAAVPLERIVEVAVSDYPDNRVLPQWLAVSSSGRRPASRDTKSGPRDWGRPVRIFISYSPEDRPFRKELEKHIMGSLRRSGLVEIWHDQMLSDGEDWAYERRRQLEGADVVLLLVSASYMASEAVSGEMEVALARHRQGVVHVVPVILRSTLLSGSPIERFHWLPRGGRPIDTWPSRDEAWVSVVQGLRNVIEYGVIRQVTLPPLPSLPASAPERSTEPKMPVVPIGDIFRRGKQPDITFVEPSQLKVLKVHLRTMGQGLVVEGPSGIGKTTAVHKAREAIAPGVACVRVRSLMPGDLALLDEALSKGFVGHLIVDDFHHLDEARKRGVANMIKAIADDSRDDAKITVIGINPVGVSLVGNFSDLAGRFDTVSMTRQPDERIAELIAKGEAAANVTFLRRDEFINAAAGSFFTAQQLCFHACVNADIDETQPTPAEIDLGVREIVNAVMASLDSKYRGPLRDFSAWDRGSAAPGACLSLLWLLSRDADGIVSVVEAVNQFPKLADTFDWLNEGNLQRAFDDIEQLSKLFYFNARAGVLTAEDPQLAFYLQNMNWIDFARKSGHAHVRLVPGGALLVESAPAVSAAPVDKASAPFGADVEPPLELPESSVLHLSDLHFGTTEQATLWYSQLADDLRELGCPKLDAVILSGDIANLSAPEEYAAARAFLSRLMEELRLSPARLVIVPGNHDLSWPLARKAYDLHRRSDYRGALREGLYIDRGEIIEVRDEDAYRRRFEEFSRFYEGIKGSPYPLEYTQQAAFQHFPEQRLLVLGLNSAWQLDHHFKLRAAIHSGALSDALSRIRVTPEYAGCLKIAVFHHPASGDGDDRIRDAGFLEQLAKAGFRVALHGHIHKARNELFRHDMNTGGRRIDLVCAGTFGAPAGEWVPGYPLGYNLLRFGGSKMIVETRRREELNGAWKPDARWLRGAGRDPAARYEIAL